MAQAVVVVGEQSMLEGMDTQYQAGVFPEMDFSAPVTSLVGLLPQMSAKPSLLSLLSTVR